MFSEFFAQNYILFAALFIILFLLVLSTVKGQVKGAKTVSALELPSLQRDGDAVIIDVNTKNDFNIAHIPDALNFPLESLNNNNKALLKLKDQTAIITCQTGSISNKAAKNLIELGFSNIHILRGGLIGWTKENLPVTSKT